MSGKGKKEVLIVGGILNLDLGLKKPWGKLCLR
jgi:hypothetical protein